MSPAKMWYVCHEIIKFDGNNWSESDLSLSRDLDPSLGVFSQGVDYPVPLHPDGEVEIAPTLDRLALVITEVNSHPLKLSDWHLLAVQLS